MSVLSENIKIFRKNRKLTQKDLATMLKVAPTAVSAWELGRNNPLMENVEQMAVIFGVKKSELLGDTLESLYNQKSDIQLIYDELSKPRQEKVLSFAKKQREEQKNDRKNDSKNSLIEYHVFEKLSAGIGETYYEDRNYDIVYFDRDIAHDLASWVFGDSMEPAFPNGSVALIKDTGWDYDGAIYAVDWDGQSYIKKVYKENDGLRLVSLNEKYTDKFAPFSEEPRIIGKVISNFIPIEK